MKTYTFYSRNMHNNYEIIKKSFKQRKTLINESYIKYSLLYLENVFYDIWNSK